VPALPLDILSGYNTTMFSHGRQYPMVRPGQGVVVTVYVRHKGRSAKGVAHGPTVADRVARVVYNVHTYWLAFEAAQAPRQETRHRVFAGQDVDINVSHRR